jgi:hypothetical protein
MASSGRAVWIAMLAAAVCGCDTTQPVQIPQNSSTLTFRSEALQDLWNVWNVEDLNGDGVPDTIDVNDDGVPDPFLWCESAGSSIRNVPMDFNISATRVLSGTARVVSLTAEAYATNFGSLTGYDDETIYDPTIPAEKTYTTPEGNVLLLTNGRRMSTNNRTFLESPKLVLPNLPGGSVCPFADPVFLGSPNIAGGPIVLPLQLMKGDTVIVKARQSAQDFIQTNRTKSPPALFADVTVDGRPLTPSGQSATAPEKGADMSFSFSVR